MTIEIKNTPVSFSAVIIIIIDITVTGVRGVCSAKLHPLLFLKKFYQWMNANGIDSDMKNHRFW